MRGKCFQLGWSCRTVVVCGLFLAMSCRNNGDHGIRVGEGTRYGNNSGGQQRIGLPDGSYVLISDGTVIVLAKDFGKSNRDLDLDGEGMFEVNGRTGRPFVVRTGNLVIELLDTLVRGADRFRVDAARKRAGEEVDLVAGRLRVGKSYHSDTDNEPEILAAGEMVMINREIDLMEKEKLSVEELDKIKGKF
jgi:transmembrane sensor